MKKIDEVRLLESRKSARLINSDTDFSKLADVSLSNSCDDKARKANNALTKSKAIEVPRSDYVQIAGYVCVDLSSLALFAYLICFHDKKIKQKSHNLLQDCCTMLQKLSKCEVKA